MAKVTHDELDRLDRQHIKDATADYDNGKRLEGFMNGFKRYQLIFDRKKYPPNMILGMALVRALVREVTSKDVCHIRTKKINSLFKRLHFTVGENPDWSYNYKGKSTSNGTGSTGVTVGPDSASQEVSPPGMATDEQEGPLEALEPVNRVSGQIGVGRAVSDPVRSVDRQTRSRREADDRNSVEVIVKVDSKVAVEMMLNRISKMSKDKLERVLTGVLKAIMLDVS